jgi:hypothetical protein
MSLTNVSLLVTVAFCLTAGVGRAADPWKSASVLPKDPNGLTLRGTASRPGTEYAGNAYQIAWPARVEQIDAQWILVGDKGGYSVPPVKGWVRKEEMLRVQDDGGATEEDPPQCLSNRMVGVTDPNKLAGLYWLRGISWESQTEPQIAMRDYAAAIRSAFGQRVDPNITTDDVTGIFHPQQGEDGARDALSRFPGLADAYLRLARLSAKSEEKSQDPLGANGKTTTATAKPSPNESWKTYFACADFLFRAQRSPAGPFNQSNPTGSGVPRLDTDWGDALAAEYSRLVAQNLASAKGENPETTRQGQNGVPQAIDTDKKRLNDLQETADKADALYKSALAVNPTWTDAYLGRGRLLLAKSVALTAAKGVTPSQDSRAVFTEAIQQFTFAIQLDPKSREAYRRRGEAYRSLASNPQLNKRYSERARYLSQAAQSADAASQLGKDRDPACLELLAKVIQSEAEMYDQLKAPKNAFNFYKQASYYWQEAASCPNADRPRLQDMLTRCRQRAGQRQLLVAETSKGLEQPAPEPEFALWVPGSNLFRDKDKE